MGEGSVCVWGGGGGGGGDQENVRFVVTYEGIRFPYNGM